MRNVNIGTLSHLYWLFLLATVISIVPWLPALRAQLAFAAKQMAIKAKRLFSSKKPQMDGRNLNAEVNQALDS